MTSSPANTAPSRLSSIDVIRGAIMVLMAIDHVRVYSGLPAGGPTAGIFFTRWVTHFCAPGFIFLAGTSAFLSSRRHPDISRHLLIRGAWLVFLELTFLRVAWTFNFDFANYEMAGVIWCIGWCMIILGLLVRLPLRTVVGFGAFVVLGASLLDPVFGRVIQAAGASPLSGLWKILYVGFFAGPIQFGSHGPTLIVLYSIVPWVGVMALGYGFGALITLEPVRRNRLCWQIGLSATGLFLVFRGFNLWGDPSHWHFPQANANGRPQLPALFSFLSTNKYPASLDFQLMTLGPTITAIPLLEGVRRMATGWLTVFGRVPFFYYMLHIPLIHALAVVVSALREGHVNPWLFTNHPMGNPAPPDGYTWPLWLLYVVWAVAIFILYFASRWFGALKARRTDWWLRYL
ncbi:MAG TPA: heparan-alpha-glucosaminide N-acetyltransferase domain-containing protein [Gemmatimonadales bacterium]|nr:heparan-alpha-glucosaminide N-acetyltransferase domain-containing protein [Gemmatimonadales bacterium]